MKRCKIMAQFPTMTNDAWIEKHSGHGGYTREKAAQQPSRGYTLYQLRCECGAIHTYSEDKEDEARETGL